jgi:transitional endoplasmic reticulum ATPase
VLVIGATNNVDLVDPAALRPGRFGVHLYVGLPDAVERAEILRIHLRGASVAPGLSLDRLLQCVVDRSEGLSGAELAFVCQTAKLHALDRNAATERDDVSLELRDFEAALDERGIPNALVT